MKTVISLCARGMKIPRARAASALVVGGIAIALFRATSSAQNMAPLGRSVVVDSSPQQKLTAVVVGATGATGRQLVRKLCSEDRWLKVTAVTRRPPADGELFEGPTPEKLTVQVIKNLEAPESEAQIIEAWAGASVLFNTLGTTRAAAGGAAAFKHVEVDLTRRAAELGRRAGVKCASVVSAQGANAGSYVDPWEALHPLLYMQTLGRKEQAMRSASFEQLSIFRPGMLNRLKGERMWENVVNRLGLGLRVDTLAAAMERDGAAMAAMAATVDGASADAVVYEGNAHIVKYSNSAVAA